MSREDIIRMAREARLNIGPAGMSQTVWGGDAELERFAALVAAEAAKAEREACAKVCAEMHLEGDDDCGLAADAIRARGQQ